MNHGECEICGRQADLFHKPSMLDGYFYSTCEECLNNGAESWKAVANFLREAEWSDLPSEFKSTVKVWQDDGYVPVEVGVNRMLERQPVPCHPEPHDEEEERVVDSILRKMREIQSTVSTPNPSTRRRKYWFTAVLAFFGFCRELPA